MKAEDYPEPERNFNTKFAGYEPQRVHNRSLHSLESLRDQVVQDIQCGDESILLLCEESTFEPSQDFLYDLLHIVFSAYHQAIQKESSDDLEDSAPNDGREIQITLDQALLFFRETGLLDNSLHHVDVIVQFYKLLLEMRASSLQQSLPAKTADGPKCPRKLSLAYEGFLQLLETCMQLRSADANHGSKGHIQVFCKFHLPHLQQRPKDGMRWIIRQANNPDLMQVSCTGRTAILSCCD